MSALDTIKTFCDNHRKEIVVAITALLIGGTAVGVTQCDGAGDKAKSDTAQQAQKSDKFLTLTTPNNQSTEWTTNFDVKPDTYPVSEEGGRIIVIGADGTPFYCTRESVTTAKNGTRRETALCFEAIEGTSNMSTKNYPDPRGTRSGAKSGEPPAEPEVWGNPLEGGGLFNSI